MSKFIFKLSALMLVVLLLVGCQTEVPTEEPPANTATATQPAPTAAATAADLPTATLEPTASPTVPPTATPAAVLVPSDCGFTDVFVSRCYTLTVPEDHNDPGSGRTIDLPVAVFASDSPAPDPIIYLSGGPGEDALETVVLNFTLIFEKLLVDRDLVMFEQRGTGSSTPSLDCPELRELSIEYLDDNLSGDESADLTLASYQACYDRLVAEGVNLGVYNSAQSAADVAALRVALGYESWNLYGVSYGTRLAQTIVRDHPQGLRSVVLDSTYPIEANLQTQTPTNLKQAMDVFFATCEADADCSTTYPELETVFWELVDQLNQDPITLTVSDLFSGETHAALINGDALVGRLFGSLYSAELTASFPKLIFNTRDGNLDLLTRSTSIAISQLDFVSFGMQMSVQCNEEISFTDPDEAAAAAAQYPELENLFTYSGVVGLLGLEICSAWDSGLALPIENEAVVSDIPTLIIHGEHDPITPPYWGQQVAEHFEKAYFFEYPGQGHGPGLTSECARSMLLEFQNDPEQAPDAACIAEMGFDFVVPLTAGDIELVPFTSDTFGISGLAPADWTEIAPGTLSDGGVNALLQQAAPGVSAADLGDILATQLGLEALPAPTGDLQSGQILWTLYQFPVEIPVQGRFMIDLALADFDGTALLILLQTDAENIAVLHEALFIPVVEALTVP